MSDTKLKRSKSSSSRVFAFLGVVVSTTSVITCVISFPLLLRLVQQLHTSVAEDLDFCRYQTKDLWSETSKLIGSATPPPLPVRHERQAETRPTPNPPGTAQGTTAAAAKPQNSDSAGPLKTDAASTPKSAAPGTCCTCHRGLAGPPGPPGYDGRPGMDMDEGEAGKPGDAAKLNYDAATLLAKDCPCTAPPGEIGAAGPKGPPGPAGKPGESGPEAPPLGTGSPPGPIGTPGLPGKPGAKGPPGDDGVVTPAKDIPAGPPGKPGNDGPNGPPGEAGKPGGIGKDGSPGAQGDPGQAGKDGQKGADGKPGPKGSPGPKGPCSHCPPPRTAPGY